MTAPAELSAFSPCVGQAFRVDAADGPVCELDLVEAKALSSRPGAPRQQPFSLLFRAPLGSGLWQGRATVAHEQTGSTDLFLVPVGEDESGTYFEALFN